MGRSENTHLDGRSQHEKHCSALHVLHIIPSQLKNSEVCLLEQLTPTHILHSFLSGTHNDFSFTCIDFEGLYLPPPPPIGCLSIALLQEPSSSGPSHHVHNLTEQFVMLQLPSPCPSAAKFRSLLVSHNESDLPFKVQFKSPVSLKCFHQPCQLTKLYRILKP